MGQILQRVLITEPGMHNANAIVDILNQNVNQMNVMIGDFNNRDFDASDRDLGEAARLFKESDRPFSGLETRQASEKLRPLYRLAAKARMHQQRMLDDARGMIAQARANNDAVQKTLSDFNAHSEEYNRNGTKIMEFTASFYAGSH